MPISRLLSSAASCEQKQQQQQQQNDTPTSREPTAQKPSTFGSRLLTDRPNAQNKITCCATTMPLRPRERLSMRLRLEFRLPDCPIARSPTIHNPRSIVYSRELLRVEHKRPGNSPTSGVALGARIRTQASNAKRTSQSKHTNEISFSSGSTRDGSNNARNA